MSTKTRKRNKSGAGAARALRQLVSAGKKQELSTAEYKAMLKESELHIAIATHIRDWVSPFVFWWHTPNGEKRDYATAAKLRRMGVKPGVHDLIFLDERTRTIYSLEVKRKGESMTDEQLVFAGVIKAMDGRTAVVDTFAGAVQQLESWGLLRIKVGGQI